jgi:hypothetical protein
MKPTPYQLSPWFDYGVWSGDEKALAMSAGPDGNIYLITGTPVTRHRSMGHGAASPEYGTIIYPDNHHVLIFDGENYEQIALPKAEYHYYGIEPLPGGDLLVNNAVYSRAGELKRILEFGAGVEDIQATSNGVIWTSYFDEGIFSGDPVSQDGLNAWSTTGERLYAYSPVEGLALIDDCYALNVASDRETWFYYYGAFHIVKIVDFKIEQFWKSPIEGCNNLAVCDDYVLLEKGYQIKNNIIHLVRLKDSTIVARYQMQDEQGNPLDASNSTARGSKLYVMAGTACYRVNVQDLIANI